MKPKQSSLTLKLFAILLMVIAVIIVCRDAYKLENSWAHPELIFYQIKYLSDANFDRVALSFDVSELKKVLWWEEVFDGCQNRILTGLFDFFNVKLRALSFRWIPPHQSFSFTWLFVFIFNPWLLYAFIRKYLKASVLTASLATVVYILSPATVGSSFQMFHSGKILTSFFYLLLLNRFCFIDQALEEGKGAPFENKARYLILTGVILFFALFVDIYAYGIFLVVPAFFPRLFFNVMGFKSCLSFQKTQQEYSVICRYPSIQRVFVRFFAIFKKKDYSAYILFACAICCFILTVFILLPVLFSLFGYAYKFMGAFKDQIKTEGATFPLFQLFSLKFYIGLLINMYWFIIASCGLRNFLPLSFSVFDTVDPSDWHTLLSLKGLLLSLGFHISCWCLFLRFVKKEFRFKKIKYIVLALYVISAWMTLVHGNASSFLIPNATFIYGSPFALVFAIFIAGVLRGYEGLKLKYLLLAIFVLLFSVSAYDGAKDLNMTLKKIWWGKELAIDAVYKENAQMWRRYKGDLKIDSAVFDIDQSVIDAYHNLEVQHDRHYNYIWQMISTNRKYINAMNFVAFSKDK